MGSRPMKRKEKIQRMIIQVVLLGLYHTSVNWISIVLMQIIPLPPPPNKLYCCGVSEIANRPFSNYQIFQLDSEAVRTKTIETRWNECEKYLHITTFLCLCPLNLSFKLNFNTGILKKAYWPLSKIP